jgi:uncharacterized protein YigA (DUF484 family)
MDGTAAAQVEPLHEEMKAYLKANPEIITSDPGFLADLGLKSAQSNVVEFGPVALSRATAAHKQESRERRKLEAIARANFAAQAQTHATVIDLLEARNHSDLARRMDEVARLRLGLAAGVLALEGPGRVPAGWRPLVEGQVDLVLGPRKLALMGHTPTALGLFGDGAAEVKSCALVRLAIWEPAREGIIAFGSANPDAFTADMGSDLVAFIARVVERTAERWPVL